MFKDFLTTAVRLLLSNPVSHLLLRQSSAVSGNGRYRATFESMGCIHNDEAIFSPARAGTTLAENYDIVAE
jgi:hypothetical protein